jgi:hypothetical protein
VCKLEGCKGKVFVKGLCAKHYMRMRRTGDPNRTRKRGPKPSIFSNAFPELSPRTNARYSKAMSLLSTCGKKAMIKAIKTATRPDGSINVNRLLGIATAMERWPR